MLTASIEDYDEVIDTIKAMFPDHHRELGLFQDKMPLAPQYGEYARRNSLGQLVMPILRKEGRIVGYWPTFVAPGLHYATTLTATMDILWVHPDVRGEGGGIMLAECLKKELKRRGVKIWYAGSKNHKDIEVFLEMLGFEPVERHFAMWIGEE